MTSTTIGGDAGFADGDGSIVPFFVYACDGCTTGTPFTTGSVAPTGGRWSASVALPAGVYTPQALQYDWAAKATWSPAVVFEIRDAVFVAADGNDTNPGSTAAPKATLGAGLTVAAAQGRPQVAVAGGVYTPTGGVVVDIRCPRSRWLRRRSRLRPTGFRGSRRHAEPQPDADRGCTPRSDRHRRGERDVRRREHRRGSEAGLAPGASVYGVRAVGASASIARRSRHQLEGDGSRRVATA